MSPIYPQLLPFVLTKQDILPTVQRLVIEHSRTIDAIVNSVEPEDATFANVLLPIATLENKQSGERAMISTLRYASPDAETQHAAHEAQKLWLDYANTVVERFDLFKLIQSVNNNNQPPDSEFAWYLNKTLLQYRQCGHGVLDSEGIRTWHFRSSRIEELCAEFNRNAREYVPGEILFTDEQLAGVPDKELQSFPVQDCGKRRVMLRMDNCLTLLRYAHNPETRRSIQLAWDQRLEKNVPIFREIVLLRDENARLLGYNSHAEYRVPQTMAESVRWIESTIDTLTQKLLPLHRKRFDRALSKKREILTEKGIGGDELKRTKLESFDKLYYDRLLNEESHVTHDQVREYFPLKYTFPAILDVCADYFQLRYEKIDNQYLANHIWHDKVTVWALWDGRSATKEDFVGYLYVDLMERQNKHRANQCVNLQPYYEDADGYQVYPATTLMCNFSPSSIHNLVLLTHAQVSTVFHELGHCMHDLLSRNKFAKLHAFEGSVELGEGVASVLERWSWMKNVLSRVSCHYTHLDKAYMDAWVQEQPDKQVPPQSIPDEVIDPVLKQRQEATLDICISELALASFDLALHNPSSRDALLNADPTCIYLSIDEKYNFTRRPESAFPYASLTDIMSRCDAGYYAYVFARVIAADLFDSAFAGNPFRQYAWDRLRDGILKLGASQDQGQILKNFLGRPPSLDAFLLSLGADSS